MLILDTLRKIIKGPFMILTNFISGSRTLLALLGIMENNYIGNTGDTDQNQLLVENRNVIDNHVAQLSVKGFTNLWQC